MARRKQLWEFYRDAVQDGDCVVFPNNEKRPVRRNMTSGKGSHVHLVERLLNEGLGVDIPSGMVASHVCDNPRCFNLEHIQIVPEIENIRDMYRKLRQYYGRNNYFPFWSMP